MAQVGRHDLFDGLGSGFVGEVTVPAEDALFKAPGPMRGILQHLDIVIGFEEEHVGATDSFEHELGGVAQVGQKTNVAPGGLEQVTDRVLSVVRNAEALDGDVTDVETPPSGEQAAIELELKGVFQRLLRGAVAEDRDAEFPVQLDQTLHVIGVFVGDEVLRGATNGGQALADLAQAKARIDQNAGFVGFQIGAIAGGTAAENG